MVDKRRVDELSIEELEQILAIRKREARQQRLQRLRNSGRVIESRPEPTPVVPKLATGQNVSPRSAAPQSPPATRKGLPQFEDDVQYAAPKSRRSDAIWRRFVDRSLLLVEVAAVVGLVVLGVAMFSGIGELEEKTAEAQALADEQRRAGIPTLEPTPQLSISQFVLPGGHPPLTTTFNYDEVPQNLQFLVQQEIMSPVIVRPPQTDDTARILIIPKLGINNTIVQGVDWEALKAGVGQLPNGITPAQRSGNVVLAAHNDIYGEIFRYLDQLEEGDQFQIQTATEVYNYTITGTQIVTPDAVHVMESGSSPTVTLISCYPYLDNSKRIVVSAVRNDVLTVN